MTKLEMGLAWSQMGQNVVMKRYVPVLIKGVGRTLRQERLVVAEG